MNTKKTPWTQTPKSDPMLALRRMKYDKALGSDEVHVELVILEETHLGPILDLFNDIYRTRELPKDWLLSFVPIPKSSKAQRCNMNTD